MKKILFSVAVLFSLASCEKVEFIEPQPTLGEESFRSVVESCAAEAYGLHMAFVADEYCCDGHPCGWDYVREDLRTKYENGLYMTTEELDTICRDIVENYPDYYDTLGEGDTFYCYEIMLHRRMK